MGDTSALEKQLNLKTKSIVELQATLEEKSRFLFDQHDMFQNKDRAIYYLERTIEAHNRELSAQKKEEEGLSAIQNKGYAKEVDAGEAAIEAAQKETDDLEAQCFQATLANRACEFQKKYYAGILARVDTGALSGKQITDALQKNLKKLEAENSSDKEEIEAMKQTIEELNDGLVARLSDKKVLEQYRVDAIFRVFTLKGKIKILGDKVKGV